MEKLITSTTAYRIFTGDLSLKRLSHAYMLYFSDQYNLRSALKLFALAFFGVSADCRDGRMIADESFPDMKIYPAPDKKITVDDASEIVDDCALKPVERDKKLYVVCGFESASPLVQNKLLKVLEEPPRGVHFLLGATSLAPVLATVKSRVKLLEIPPFSDGEIFLALERLSKNPLNRAAAESAEGVLGAAENALKGEWFGQVNAAAEEICSVKEIDKAAQCAVKYGDTKYKTELLSAMERVYARQLKNIISNGDTAGAIYEKPVYIYALESINSAFADLKFNANFSSLLYDFTLRVIMENDKWKRL